MRQKMISIYSSMSKKINLIGAVENYEVFSVLSYMPVVCKQEQKQIKNTETRLYSKNNFFTARLFKSQLTLYKYSSTKVGLTSIRIHLEPQKYLVISTELCVF